MSSLKTVLLVVSLLATLWLACRATTCKAPTAFFDVNPMNQTVELGQEGVNITCRLNMDTGLSWRWIHTLDDEQISTSPNGPYTLTSDGGLSFDNPVTIRNHGSYQCDLVGCTQSYIGHLNVAGVPLLEFSEDPINTIISEMAGGNITRDFFTFGYPSPNITLRRKTGDSYTTFESSKVVPSTKTLIINGVERSDSGDYQIVATNTYGSYMLNFTLNITGVGSPCPVTIIPTSSDDIVSAQYNNQVLISCSTPEEAYDQNSNSQQLMIEWRDKNGGVISSDNNFETRGAQTQLNLTIKSLNRDLNGLYTCFALNTRGSCMKQVMVIGPPAKVNNLNATLLPGGLVTLTWTEPETFGAEVSMYEINYRSTNGSPGKITVNSSSDSPQNHTQRFCPHGMYYFKVAAVDEHNSIGEYSQEQIVEIPESYCPTEVPNTSGTGGGGTNTNSPKMTPTMTLIATDPVPGATTAIIAGSVAGLALLATVIIFAMLTYCYLGVFRKRFSGRHEWSVRDESPDMPVSSPPYDGKSPEPNGILAGLPSPIPLDGNGYMPAPYANSNIDPRFEFPRENLEFTDVLFDGRQTVIYKAATRGIKDDRCIDVAVKAIKEEFTVYDEYVSALLLEMEELAQLEPHPNVVGLIRVCTVGRPLYMVMEYMCHGDLLGFLRSTRGHENMYTVLPCNDNPPIHLKLTSRDLLRIATQISCGMQFLSERKIVHGALCARNILVSNSMEVKVFNIGCHNLYNEEPFESLEKWLAPENISNGQRTTYGDVWSYGVLLWEVVTVGGTPYSEINSEDLLEQLQAGMRLPRPPHCAQPVYNIMEECWKAFPQDRPLFSEIYDSLDHLNLSKMSYLDLRSYDKTAYSQFDNEMSLTSAL